VTVRQPEIDRLTLEAEVWRREAEALIALAGPSPVARCLDACCGPLGALAALAAAAPDGEVVGVEADAELARDARDEVARRGLRNVTVVTDDLLEYRPPHLFDLVYMRFAPVSLGRPGRRMLEALRALCLPGGAVLMQEPFGAFHYAGAPSGALEKLLALATTAYLREGVDMHAGRRLSSRLAAAGLTDVVERRARIALPPAHPYLRLPLMLAGALGDDILELGTVASADLVELRRLAEIESAAPGLRATTFELVGAVGRVPLITRAAGADGAAQPSAVVPA
jgi:predicted RNA methylase